MHLPSKMLKHLIVIFIFSLLNVPSRDKVVDNVAMMVVCLNIAPVLI